MEIGRFLGLVLGCLLGLTAARAEAAPPRTAPSPRRIAVVVGANAAAPGRKSLRYSQNDAQSVGRVLVELGGFSSKDVTLLLDPEPELVLKALDAKLAELRASGEDALFLFYYSGHADSTALYPHGRPLAIDDLRTRFQDPRVSVRIGVIDACRGGGWTGAKGLSEAEPFSVDLPTALANEGSVLIASSSGLEDAHESESLGGSFFTHHWIAALRGAADRNADGDVTLAESFDYARALTIRDTALYTAAPQHPSFSMQLRGRNDLPLTTLHVASAMLTVDQREGPLELVHLGTGMVVLEIPKGERSVRLAVAPGRYLLRRRSGQKMWAQEIEVKPGRMARIDEARLTLVGTTLLSVKRAQPRPLTLSTVPKGMQELTFSLGVSHTYAAGVQLGSDGDFQFSLVAPRGLTDRWQWLIPTLAFAYRGGDLGGLEWLPWGGIVNWGMGFSSLDGFILEADPGFGFDLRHWLTARSSLEFGIGFRSRLRWTSNDPRDITWNTTTSSGETTTYNLPDRWTPPNTWRGGLVVGYTHTLADTVTFHLALGMGQTQLVDGHWADHGTRSKEGKLALSFGSMQTLGLRPLPLVRVHVRDWFALNLDAVIRYNFADQSHDETYLGGASCLW